MFNKILIANRGEIAVRIIRACQELGIRTVAVYSEVDRNSLHVRFADEAYCIGPAPSRESYLRMDKILEVAKKSETDAIHPGYGFLAEREDFAQACADEGIVFIGPSPSAIAKMGDKAVARATVQHAGVPVIPGTEGEANLSDEELLNVAPSIGFPLLIKASAGGGGKGQREVRNIEDMPALLKAARRESESAFGDGAVYLERMVEGARHIEVQLLGDTHGNIIHLYERECSLQRRRQKLVEESPSPALDEDQRRKIGEMAVRAAQAVNYVNAGTIECLYDKQGNIYFMEMNTRLQVEHPITERVTGVDIVKEQIRIARGRKLRYSQDDIQQTGWAIECRINAEDPFNNFMPSTGTVTRINFPVGIGVRIESGVYEGFTITPYYDSMIAKLICWGETRPEAILRMRRALNEMRIMGVKTNVPFHQQLIGSLRFQAGHFDTRFVEDRFELEDEGHKHADIAAIAATLVAHQKGQQNASHIGRGEQKASRWRWGAR
ncbi:MAG TPA: acetyl-CoA carboxylase biotin carboxylase subunit [Thermoflexales bacterium]|nr:acetyl-CoA carboxylase biotin carboxylase subunit [Thermoflexales bacterium]HQZ20716.1 acetyl-CoA carboxylase biotin carboxylase subunit [Thermoflexales bacterium]HRA00308.1 acetyl-CoA carboxylase biotin carboxylase subunit [Thermoflexales bacterium]